ncbi:hypothetical protein WH47_08218 [Habropoda laboriosa]|uniref:Uncharacterized protein n=1 Tax=Habropoda laboriosa TaxID=597456 RepID=A0A0L7RG72_9HYME|nr:hypothetical protein WH47_08218 [Habropoda laboriosa]
MDKLSAVSSPSESRRQPAVTGLATFLLALSASRIDDRSPFVKRGQATEERSETSTAHRRHDARGKNVHDKKPRASLGKSQEVEARAYIAKAILLSSRTKKPEDVWKTSLDSSPRGPRVARPSSKEQHPNDIRPEFHQIVHNRANLPEAKYRNRSQEEFLDLEQS